MTQRVTRYPGKSRRAGAVLSLLLASGLPISAQSPGRPIQPDPSSRSATRAPFAPNRRAAKIAFEEGQRAEQVGDWEAAFRNYTEAAAKSPSDRAIRLRQELARFALVQQRTGLAAKEVLAGQTTRARQYLQEALRLDPGYSIAREQLAQLGPQAPPSAIAVDQGVGATQFDLPTGKRDFDYRGTTRGAYEEIARQFGLTATFDGDLVDRQIRFRAPGVDFETAMRLLSGQTTTFWRPLGVRTFFVAADTPQKRGDYAPQIEQTLQLPASETIDDMTETTRMIREIVGLRRVQLNSQEHTITIRDSPENVALAQALVRQIEQPHGELLLEIDILEVNRDVARRLGITPPSTAQSISLSGSVLRQLQDALGAGTLPQTLQGIFGAGNPLVGAQRAVGAALPFLLFGGGRTFFLSTMPGAAATFSETVSAVRRAQRVLLRVADGKAGSFFVGDRFPITLALLSSSLVAPPSQFIAGVLPGSFPRQDFTVGRSPAGVTVGDFDDDGKLDIATANQTDGTVSILLGNGDGTFAAHQDIPCGMGPAGIVSGDFDRDGHADLAVVNSTESTVSILHGLGDGNFDAAVNLPTGLTPVAVITGDFNKDQNPDLAVANQTGDSVSILLGRGDGTFAAKTDFPAGSIPSALITGDFDNDGNPDVAVANTGSNTFSVLLGNGAGAFVRSLPDAATGSAPSGIATGDFDADGRADLAVTNQTAATLSIFPGNGDGTFGAATTLTAAAGPVALLQADFNADNRPDLVAANSGDSFSVFLGLGDGTFADRIDLPSGDAPAAMASGDFDGDSLPDLAVANRASNTVTVTLNRANIPVTTGSPLSTYPASEYVDLGLKVQATPRLHPGDEVTLDLQFDIKSLTGQDVNGIPILSTRTVQQSVRLKENQTNVLAGLIQSSELRGISGLPGLATLPIAGHLAGLHTKEESDTELLIAVTPRQLRLAPRTDRAIYAGRGTGTMPAPAPPTVLPGQPTPPAIGAPPAPPVVGPPGAPTGAPPLGNAQPGAPGATPEPPPGNAPPNPQPGQPEAQPQPPPGPAPSQPN